jgi:hypothetical protein
MLGDIHAALSGKPFHSSGTTDTSKSEPSAARDIASGLVTGPVAQTLGAPVDLATGTINAVAEAARSLASDVAHPVDTLTGMLPVVGEAINPGGATRDIQRQRDILATPLIGAGNSQKAQTLSGLVTGNKLESQPTAPIPGGSEWFNQVLGAAGLPTTENTQPTTTAGKLLQQGSRAAGAFAGPGIAGKLAGAAGLPAADEALSALAPGNITQNLAYGAASGVAGEAGKELAPPGYERVGETIGSLAGGIVPAGAIAGTVGLARGAQHILPPITAAGREAAAGNLASQALERSAADPNAAFDALQDRVEADNAELIPGSKPTTAELANGPGLAALERTRARQNPQMATAVTEQRAENNEARVKALSGMAPETATPEAAQTALRQHLQSIDDLGAKNLEAARQGVENTFEPATTTLEQQENQAQSEATNAVNSLGGAEAMGSAEERTAAPAAYGAAMRDPAQEAYVAERSRLNDLRQAVDPSGTMGMRPDAAKAAVGDINDTFKPEGGVMYSGAERHLYDTVNGWGSLIPIDQAFQMRANINGRLAQAMDHSPQEAKRLLMLKQGVDQSIADAVGDTQVAEQAGAINKDAPPIEDRIAGLASTPGMGPSFIQDVARAYASNPTALRAARGDETGRGILAAADRQAEPVPAGTVVGGGGEGRDPNGGSGGGAGGEGVPQEPALTPLTDEARQRFAQWNQEYAEMKRQFQGETAGKLHAVGKMLQKGGAHDSFKLADSQVPWLFVDGKQTAKEDIQRFLAATPPEAHQALDNAYSFSLRRAAQNPDTGALDLPKYNRWLTAHEAGLSERPELLNRFNTAAKAQQRLNDIRSDLADLQKSYADALKGAEKGATSDHLDARNAFTKSVAGQFIGDDPDKAIMRVFTGPDRAQKVQTLMGLMAGNKPAIEGLQRAAIDHIIEKYSGSAMAGAESGALKPQMLQDFIAANRGVLDVLFPGGLAKNFDALSEDLKRSQLVPNAKLPGGSDTMQLQNAAKEHEVEPDKGNLLQLATAFAAERAGEALTGIPGAAIAVPLTMRWLKGKSSALQLRANQMLDQMLLDPKYAVEMRNAYPAKGEVVRPAVMNRFAARVVQNAVQTARGTDLMASQQRPRYKAGGPVADDAVRGMPIKMQGRHLADLAMKIRQQHFADGGGVASDDEPDQDDTEDDPRGLPIAAQGAHLADMAEKYRKEMSARDEAAVPAD